MTMMMIIRARFIADAAVNTIRACLPPYNTIKKKFSKIQVWRRFGIDYERCLSLDPKGPRVDPCEQV